MELPPPKTKKNLRSILGMLNYYRAFIPNFSIVAKPLYSLVASTPDGKPVKWLPEHADCLAELRRLMKQQVVLSHPDYNGTYRIDVDASRTGIGACLYQNDRPVQFISRTLTISETNYGITKLELTGIVWALSKLREYVLNGKRHIVRTDHKPLLGLLRLKTNKDFLRLLMKLEEYDFDLQYVEGKLNIIADFLSRRSDKLSSISAIQPSQPHILDPNRIKMALQHDSSPTDENLVEHDGLLFQNHRLYIPTSLRQELLEYLHTRLFNHLSFTKVWKYLDDRFYWNSMKFDARNFIASCPTCQQTKPSSNNTAQLTPIPVVPRPFHKLCMDVAGPLSTDSEGFRYILVSICPFSKFIFASPLKAVTSSDIIRALTTTVFNVVGVPSEIMTDNASYFTSQLQKKFLSDFNISLVNSTPYRHQSNGQVENAIRTVNYFLRSLTPREKKTWNKHLARFEFGYRCSYHSSIGMTPFELVWGTTPTLFNPPNLQDCGTFNEKEWIQTFKTFRKLSFSRVSGSIKKSKAKQKALHDQKLKTKRSDFKIGDQVMRKINNPSSKLSNTYEGPFTVSKILDNGNLELKYPEKIHTEKRIKVHFSSVKRFVADTKAPPQRELDDDEYEVESIIDHTSETPRKYLIKWKFYDLRQSTWEDESNLDNCPDILADNQEPAIMENTKPTNHQTTFFPPGGLGDPDFWVFGLTGEAG
jgi:hypothetical protein